MWLTPSGAAGVPLNGFFGRRLSKSVVVKIGCGRGPVSAGLDQGRVGAAGAGQQDARRSNMVAPWIGVGHFRADWGLLLDPLSAVMILVVSGVGFLIHVYAVGYMHGDRDFPRFFTYLNLFTFSMLMLVLANNYLLLYVFWEAVGLCSYLLIGFWFERPAAAEAGKKAFIVNRVGDFGFGLGVMLLWTTLGTLQYEDVFAAAPARLAVGGGLVTAITLLLFLGATGKSAQIPLYVWLPDAMEGPTPVSALIHAATMVTAGVYMVARSAPLFNLAPVSMAAVAWIGGITASLPPASRWSDRHQAGDRVFHHLSTRVHVPGLRGGRVRRGHLPPDDARVLQGAAVPGGGLRHPRPRWGAGPPQDGRTAPTHAGHGLDLPRRGAGQCRDRPAGRLLVEGRDPVRAFAGGVASGLVSAGRSSPVFTCSLLLAGVRGPSRRRSRPRTNPPGDDLPLAILALRRGGGIRGFPPGTGSTTGSWNRSSRRRRMAVHGR
jgi:hypothetical protein